MESFRSAERYPEILRNPENENLRPYTVVNPDQLGGQTLSQLMNKIKNRGFSKVRVDATLNTSLIDGQPLVDGITILVAGEERY
jgi:hypothetical protein